MKYSLHNLPILPFISYSEKLSAGVPYGFKTTDLRASSGRIPDTMMFLVRYGKLEAWDNDGSGDGRGSEIIFTPTETDWYSLYIFAFRASSYGTCDVWIKRGEAPYYKIFNDQEFYGYRIEAKWNANEYIATGKTVGTWGNPVEPVLFLVDFTRDLFFWNFAGSIAPGAWIKPGYDGDGYIFVGTWSKHFIGIGEVGLYFQSYLHDWEKEGSVVDLAPPSPLIFNVSVTEYIGEINSDTTPRDAMKDLVNKLRAERPNLLKLHPDERIVLQNV